MKYDKRGDSSIYVSNPFSRTLKDPPGNPTYAAFNLPNRLMMWSPSRMFIDCMTARATIFTFHGFNPIPKMFNGGMLIVLGANGADDYECKLVRFWVPGVTAGDTSTRDERQRKFRYAESDDLGKKGIEDHRPVRERERVAQLVNEVWITRKVMYSQSACEP